MLHKWAPIFSYVPFRTWVSVTLINFKLSGIALRYGLDDRGFESSQGLGIFLFTTASRPALRPTQPPTQWVTGALSLGVKLPEREADHSPASSAEVKNSRSCIFTPQYTFMAWCSVKAQGQICLFYTFTLPSLGSSVSIGTRLEARRPQFNSREVQYGNFVLGPTQLPIQWVPRVLSLRARRPGRESDHWSPSSSEVKNAWSYT
jgi:hypothetical protein